MSGNPMDYLWDEVAAYKRLGEKKVDAIVNAPKNAIKEIMHLANDKANGSYPIAHEFMKRSIDGKGAVKYGPGTRIAKAILSSPEFIALAKKRGNSCFSNASIKFRSDGNLSRSIHDGSISGDLMLDGKKFTFKGKLTDTYDFRYDWLPKSLTWNGVKLRMAGNIAKACTDVGLMKDFQVTVEIDGSGTL